MVALIVLFASLYFIVRSNEAHSGKKGVALGTKESPKRTYSYVYRKRRFSKVELGRCANAVGRYGYDVSNPIRVKSIFDKCFGEYLDDMYIDGDNVSGWIVVSACLCPLFGNKPVYKVAVRKNDGKSYVTLFFIEDGTTTPRFLPKGIKNSHSMYFEELVKNGGGVCFKDEVFGHWDLLGQEENQKPVAASKEKIYTFRRPELREGEDKEHFALRLRDNMDRRVLADGYWAFIRSQKHNANLHYASKSEYEANEIVKKYLGKRMTGE